MPHGPVVDPLAPVAGTAPSGLAEPDADADDEAAELVEADGEALGVGAFDADADPDADALALAEVDALTCAEGLVDAVGALLVGFVDAPTGGVRVGWVLGGTVPT